MINDEGTNQPGCTREMRDLMFGAGFTPEISERSSFLRAKGSTPLELSRTYLTAKGQPSQLTRGTLERISAGRSKFKPEESSPARREAWKEKRDVFSSVVHRDYVGPSIFLHDLISDLQPHPRSTLPASTETTADPTYCANNYPPLRVSLCPRAPSIFY